MSWYMNNELFDPSEDFLKEYVGFVYEIEEKDTKKKYIGKKFFWKPKTLPVTKTRKRKIKTKVLSDWKNYYGSNEALKENVDKKDKINYNRSILVLCKTKGDCSYHEARLQFENEVLMREDYYNNSIGCKIHTKHLTPKNYI